MGDNVEFRIEHDTMGEVKVPRDALWRAQTQRAVENFPISGRPLAPALVPTINNSAELMPSRPPPSSSPAVKVLATLARPSSRSPEPS